MILDKLGVSKGQEDSKTNDANKKTESVNVDNNPLSPTEDPNLDKTGTSSATKSLTHEFFELDEDTIREIRKSILVSRKDSSRKVYEREMSKQMERIQSEGENPWAAESDEEPDKNFVSPEVFNPQITHKAKKFLSPQVRPLTDVFGLARLERINETEKDFLAETFPLARGRPLVIGVCGGNCAGKMDLVNYIIKRVGPKNCTIVKQENFYKSLPEKESLADFNYDDPEATDWDLMEAGLDALLISKKPFDTPIYDLKLNRRDKRTEQIWPNPIIIVEGLLIFHIEGIRKRLNLKIFLDTDDDVRLSRRIIKDCVRLGRNVNETIDRYKKFVKPCHEKYVLPSRKYADIILPDFGSNICEEIEYMNKNKTEAEKSPDESKSNAPFKTNLALELMIEQIVSELELQHDIRMYKKLMI